MDHLPQLTELQQTILEFILILGIPILGTYIVYKLIKSDLNKSIKYILEQDESTNYKYMRHENQEEIDNILDD